MARAVSAAVVGLVGAVVAAASGTSAAPPRVAEIQMTEFAFRPAVVQISAGRPVTLVLINRGQLAHQFGTVYLRTVASRVVSGALMVDSVGLEVVRLNPGVSARLEFLPLRRGRVAFACTIEGHREAGMTGLLDVR
jgi:uncharacterized cupredoxin-like copper-binding protein